MGGEGEMYGRSNMETYIAMCKIDSQCMAQETQTGVPSQPRGKWEGSSKGRVYMYTHS